MRTIALLGLIGLLSVRIAMQTSTAQAARLVVMAVNSGNDTSSPYVNNQPPNLPPGAKGFLIGIDLQDGLVDIPLGVQDLQFTNVVHKQGINDENGDPLPVPLNIKTRSQASLQQVADRVAANGYLRSDSYVMDNNQQGAYVWSPVGSGFEGGEVGDTFLKITASLGIPSAIDGPGPVQLAYIVATGNVAISGFIARGAVGFNVCGDPIGSPRPIYLDFQADLIVCNPAEPSTLLLAGMGLAGLALGTWRRSK